MGKLSMNDSSCSISGAILTGIGEVCLDGAGMVTNGCVFFI
jgi:hypothetical protein